MILKGESRFGGAFTPLSTLVLLAVLEKWSVLQRKELPHNTDVPEMFNDFDIIAGKKARRTDGQTLAESPSKPVAQNRSVSLQKPIFSKLFRWQPLDAQISQPESVKVVGSFTNWCAVALTRETITNTWQLMLHEIPGNRTHRYMLLVNGEPAQDKHADGLAVPEGFYEQQFQLMTPRGPRVFLLFAQTK